MIQLNYHHLYYFKTIATEGSISKAAVRLRLGQPTLSMQLKQFEEYLGHALFERRNRRLVLTEMGRMVLSYSNEIFRLGEEMVGAISERPTLKREKLHIGALDSVPKSIVAALVARAYSLGDCQITLLEGQGPELMDELANYRLDLVISNSASPSLSTEKIYARSLLKTPLIVVGTEKFLHIRKDFPKSLNSKPLLLPTAHSRVRHDIEYFFEANHLMMDLVAEAQDGSLLKELALAGHGLMVTSKVSVASELAQDKLYEMGTLTDYFEEIWLIAAQRTLQSPMAQALMKEGGAKGGSEHSSQ